MRKKIAALTAVVTAAALSLAACGGSAPAQSGQMSSSLSWRDSPLDKLYAGAFEMSQVEKEEQAAKDKANSRKYEELVAKCMSDQGFDYVVFTYPTSEETYQDEPDPDPVEYAQKYGYNFTTGDEDPEMPIEDDQPEVKDPNWETYASLSESEKVAWDKALYGDEKFAPEGGDMPPTGCSGAAQKEIFPEDQATEPNPYDDPQWQDLVTQMNDLYMKAEKSPKKVELDRKWSDCIADLGYANFTTPFDAYEHVMNLAEGMWDEETGEVNKAIQQKVRPEEIKVAVADATCQQKVHYQDEILRIQFSLEQEFIDANKEQLDAFLEAMALASR